MTRHINHLKNGTGLLQRRSLRLALYGCLTALTAIAVAATQVPDTSTINVPARAAVTVVALEVQPESGFTLERRFIGRVEAGRVSAVGFESGGLLGAIGVDEGDQVKAGDELAHLDTARFRVQRAELVAALKAEKAHLVLSQQTLERQENLVKRGVASHQAVDEAKNRDRSAQAEVELAQARVDAIDVELDKSVLIAPFDAVITRRYEDEGRVVAVGEPVLELQEQRRTEVRVGVAGPLVANIAVGQERSLDVNGATIPATVKAVLPVRGADTRTVDVILSLDDAYDRLRDGDLMTLRLVEPVRESGYWLPVEALAEGMRGLWTAYVLQPVADNAQAPQTDASHEAVRFVVDILHAESNRVFVRATLPQAALVVATGVHKVVPGQRVRLADEEFQFADGVNPDAIH